MHERQSYFDGSNHEVEALSSDMVQPVDSHEQFPRSELFRFSEPIGITKDGGILCLNCINYERPKELDESDKQWFLLGLQFSDEHHCSCDHCYRDVFCYHKTQESYNKACDNTEVEFQDFVDSAFNRFFRNNEDWIDDYVKSDDYGGEYAYLVGECERYGEEIEKVLTGRAYNVEPFPLTFPPSYSPRVHCHSDFSWNGSRREEKQISSFSPSATLPSSVLREIEESVLDCMECTATDEYSTTCGEIYLDSFDVGEYEDQVEVSRIQELCPELNPTGEVENEDLDIRWDFIDLLEEWIERQNDFCLRSHFNSLRREYACLYHYVDTGVRWDYHVDLEVLHRILVEQTIDYCQRADFNRNGKLQWNSENRRFE